MLNSINKKLWAEEQNFLFDSVTFDFYQAIFMSFNTDPQLTYGKPSKKRVSIKNFS